MHVYWNNAHCESHGGSRAKSRLYIALLARSRAVRLQALEARKLLEWEPRARELWGMFKKDEEGRSALGHHLDIEERIWNLALERALVVWKNIIYLLANKIERDKNECISTNPNELRL